MAFSSSSTGRPIVLSSSTEGQVYGLFALALALTLAGVWLGMMFQAVLLSSGVLFLLIIASLAIVFTAVWWVNRAPLNILLFALFPLITGLGFTPYLLYILASYVNGGAILVNALGATTCMALGAAFFAVTTKWNLDMFSRVLIFGLLGLIFFGLFQIFIPALRTGVTELVVSGAAVLLFAAFTAVDVQRIQRMGRVGANPFLLALSLYLDIYNLFLYVLRFMLVFSGSRRD